MEGKCRLCLVETEIKNSHIIPEFFYTPMYDSFNRYSQISTIPDERNIFFQKGVREYLLCERCEQQFSKYEQYVSQALYHKEPEETKQDDKIFIVENVDYSLMKLFQLSVLWRAAISSKEIFRDVNLGPHQEILRNMLQNENPGKDYNFGCLNFALILDTNKLADGLIMPPTLFRLDSFRVCRFTFGGLIWIYFLSSHNIQYRWKEFFLLECGKLTIHKKKFDEVKFLVDFGNNLKRQEKLDNQKKS